MKQCHSCNKLICSKKPCTSINTDGSLFNCQKCKVDELEIETHGEENDRSQFKCKLCKFRFNHKRNLMRHMKQQPLAMEVHRSKFEEEDIITELVLKMK